MYKFKYKLFHYDENVKTPTSVNDIKYTQYKNEEGVITDPALTYLHIDEDKKYNTDYMTLGSIQSLSKESTPIQTGGNSIYYHKYMKYKVKYLKLKNEN